MNATMWLIAGVLSLVIGGSAAAITMKINERAVQSAGALRGGFFIAAVAVTAASLIALAFLLIFGSPDTGHTAETIALAIQGGLLVGVLLDLIALDLIAASKAGQQPRSQAEPQLIEHNEQDSK